ncbi:MAG: hypothetical protein ACTS53_01155 [Candidatus Hodgkinia cicadicola]
MTHFDWWSLERKLALAFPLFNIIASSSFISVNTSVGCSLSSCRKSTEEYQTLWLCLNSLDYCSVTQIKYFLDHCGFKLEVIIHN